MNLPKGDGHDLEAASTSEYQTCPKCGGQGFVAKPPWVAGDLYHWMDTGTPSYSCPVCHGQKVLVRP